MKINKEAIKATAELSNLMISNMRLATNIARNIEKSFGGFYEPEKLKELVDTCFSTYQHAHAEHNVMHDISSNFLMEYILQASYEFLEENKAKIIDGKFPHVTEHSAMIKLEILVNGLENF